MKRAIIYYSLTDNTKTAAEKLSAELNADIYRIELEKPLPSSKAKQMFEGGRQAVFELCPDITGVSERFCDYDEIILGMPVWAGKPASPINTLLTDKALAKKVTAVFTFSGGGDNRSCIKALSKKLDNLKYDIALADRNSKLAGENDKKLNEFVQKLG